MVKRYAITIGRVFFINFSFTDIEDCSNSRSFNLMAFNTNEEITDFSKKFCF